MVIFFNQCWSRLCLGFVGRKK